MVDNDGIEDPYIPLQGDLTATDWQIMMEDYEPIEYSEWELNVRSQFTEYMKSSHCTEYEPEEIYEEYPEFHGRIAELFCAWRAGANLLTPPKTTSLTFNEALEAMMANPGVKWTCSVLNGKSVRFLHGLFWEHDGVDVSKFRLFGDVVCATEWHVAEEEK